MESIKLEKFKGMLLGLHVGDSLGATLEFQDAIWDKVNWQRDIIGGGHYNWAPGDPTDDTDLMLCVLRSIISPIEFSFEELQNNFIEWIKRGPIDIGTTTRNSLERLRAGHSLEECGGTAESSQGNGSLMRCAPLAILEMPDHELQKTIELQAKITHAHPRCLIADRLFIHALKMALRSESKELIWKSTLAMALPLDMEFYSSLKEIPDVSWEVLSTTGYVLDTLSTAFWALLNSSSFEDALIKVVNRGGDADTHGAVAGALCGAYYGEGAIPSRWIEKICERVQIEEEIKRVTSNK